MRNTIKTLAFIFSLTPHHPTYAAELPPNTNLIPPNAASLKNKTINLTLQDAVYTGLANNRSIKISHINRISQSFDLLVSEDRFTPKVTITANKISGRSDDDRYRQIEAAPNTELLTPIGTHFSLSWNSQLYQGSHSGRSGGDGATFSIIQPLLKDAGYEVNIAPLRLAKLQEEINKLALKSSISNTITAIIMAYRDLQSSQEQLRIAEDGLSRAKELLATNNALIKAGRMAEFESVQTEADIASQELNVEETKNQLLNNRVTLLQLLAMDLDADVRASEKITAEPFTITSNQAISKAKENEPTYLAQLIKIKLAQTSLLVAKNQRLWDLSIIAGASQNRLTSTAESITTTDRHWDTYTGIQISIPLGDLSLRQAEVRAETDLDTQKVQAEEAGEMLKKDVISQVHAINTRWRQVELSGNSKELTARKLEIEHKKLTSGRSSNFEVISYEADLRNVESTYLNAIISYLNAQTQLDSTLGTTLESWGISLNDQ